MAKQIKTELSTEETVVKIEKALEDLQKGLATKNEVIKLIDERVETDNEAIEAAAKAAEEATDEIEILKSEADSFKAQLKRLRAGSYASLKGSDGSYTGLFRSPEEAKAVGLMIMGASLKAGEQNSQVKTKLDAVLKTLDELAIDVKWLNDNGVKAGTTGGQGTGSVLVTTEQAPGIIMLLQRYGKYRANAMHVPLAATTTLMPKIDSLLTVYVPGEGTAPSLQDLTAGLISLTPKTMTALTAYSLELDEDSAIGLAELYGNLFARSFAYYEDLCGFLGDGTSTYFGFVGIAGALRAVDSTIGNIKSLVVGSGNAYGELVLGDFEKLAGTLPDFAEDGAKFYAHKYFYFTVMLKLALAAGGSNATEAISGVGKKSRSFLGYDFDPVNVMPKVAANSQIACLLGDLRLGAMLGTRGGLEFASSDQRYFDQGLVALRGRSRVCINVPGVGNTSDAGPICALILAAS